MKTSCFTMSKKERKHKNNWVWSDVEKNQDIVQNHDVVYDSNNNFKNGFIIKLAIVLVI